MAIKTVDIPPLGEVVFAQTKRAKRISISVRPFKGIRVAFPPRISFRKARKYMVSNVDWAAKNLEYMKKLEAEHNETVNGRSKPSRSKARMILTERLRVLADKYGFRYNRVFIRNQKTRWGSCSHLNNISLNIHLVTLTDELMDYVILHELVHTEIKNHSKRYWAELDKYVGGRAKEFDKMLRKHRL